MIFWIILAVILGIGIGSLAMIALFMWIFKDVYQ